MSEAVLADSQFSIARIFRPFLNFEDIYQDEPVSTPIAIPGDLDRSAGVTGFDPNLLSGIPVPFGSKLEMWVPTLFNISSDASGLVIQSYRYRFIWRVRNLRDFQDPEVRAAYHFPRQSLGENSQFVIPSAAKGLVYETQPITTATNQDGGNPAASAFTTQTYAVQRSVIESVRFPSAIPNPPLTPAGVAASFQQGLAQDAFGSNQTVTFNQIQMDAMGDELLVLIDREYDPEGVDNTWDFQYSGEFPTGPGVDTGFSAFYGTASGSRQPIRDMGIYIFTGSNP